MGLRVAAHVLCVMFFVKLYSPEAQGKLTSSRSTGLLVQEGQTPAGESEVNFSAGIKEYGSELIHTAASVMLV